MVQEFCQSRRASCTVKYQGSLDIALALKAGNDPQADAVGPAASIWIDMFDTARRVKSVKSDCANAGSSSASSGPGRRRWAGSAPR